MPCMPSKPTRTSSLWLEDLRTVGYSFPTKVPPLPFSTPPLFAPISIRQSANGSLTSVSALRQRVRAAVCVTGQIDIVGKGYAAALPVLREYLPGNNVHPFVFASTFIASTSDLATLLILPATRLVIHTDRRLGLTFPYERNLDEFPDGHAPRDFDDSNRMLQQVWAQNICYSAVRDWGAHYGIDYDLLVRQRTRTDTVIRVRNRWEADTGRTVTAEA
jgi:hypothetical protein